MTLPPWFDMQVHAGDVLLTAMLGLLGYGLRKTVKVVREFLEDTRGYRRQADRTSLMVDRHTMAMRKHSILGPPAGRVYHGKERRKDDEEVDILEDTEAAST